MKSKFNFQGFALACIICISACQTPEQRVASDKTRADTLNTMNNTAGDSVSVMLTQPADTLTVTPSSNRATMDSAVSASNKKGNTKKGKAIVSATSMNSKNEKMQKDKNGVYGRAEIMPSYPGGDKALQKFVEDNLQYPQQAIDNGTEGKVVVQFDVDESGKIYNPMIVSQKIGDGLEDEAVKIVKQMPRWNPGQIKGKNVKTKFTLPVVYHIQ